MPDDPLSVAQEAADELRRPLRHRHVRRRRRPRLGLEAGRRSGSASPPSTSPRPSCPASPPPRSTGHEGRILAVDRGARLVLVFQGRTHLYEGHGVNAVAHGVRTAVEAGCRVVVLTNACGAIDTTLVTGEPVLISDHISMTAISPLVGAAVRRPHRSLRGAAAAACPRGRPEPARGRVRALARPRVRDAGRDPHAADARRRPRRHVHGAGGDRRPRARRRGARDLARDEPGRGSRRREAVASGRDGDRRCLCGTAVRRCSPAILDRI